MVALYLSWKPYKGILLMTEDATAADSISKASIQNAGILTVRGYCFLSWIVLANLSSEPSRGASEALEWGEPFDR